MSQNVQNGTTKKQVYNAESSIQDLPCACQDCQHRALHGNCDASASKQLTCLEFAGVASQK